MHLTDEQWSLVAPLFPLPRSGRGRPLIDERPILDAVLWKLATGCAWYDLPPQYPSHQTVYRRYIAWKKSGLLRKILSTLLNDLVERGGVVPYELLENGLLTLERRHGRMQIQLDPSLRNTWQLATALMFINLAIQKARRRSTPFD